MGPVLVGFTLPYKHPRRAASRWLNPAVIPSEAAQPRVLAVLGLGAYRTAFQCPRAVVGLQPERIGATHIWLLPNPSGLNAHHKPADFVRLFAALREYVDRLTA